ncbi:pseudouridylate synthase RPUSD4, mitochondrial [Xylocopa sonorina]|uniref:pseudouridylate synthase RPUSD4, mitochondrial n=1 Tax=Xylocopa sonorina TaxID=1818115 RepID=UPI00403AD7B4
MLKTIHPYKQIHPWKSLTEFAEDLLNNIIYNKDGLVALNKPYGIRCSRVQSDKNTYNNIPNGVNYTLEDVLPYICDRLNYQNLKIVRCPELYMSGVTLLAANANIQNAVSLAYIRSHFFANTYWIITIGVPRELRGQHRLAIKLISKPPLKHKKATIITSWSNNDEKYGRMQLLKTEYNVLSNSTLNLCSLIKIKSSTEKRHAIRLFASTFLYCPILGDNICASQIQKVGNTFVKVDPFLTHPAPPKLDEKLLKLLNVRPRDLYIIPAHIHLKSTVLPMFLGNTLTIEAPLSPSFDWTCKQLEFKHLLQKNIS